jgi:hypothetical protein
MADEPIDLAFAERVDDRFDQMVELIKSSFCALDQKVDHVDGKIDKVDARLDRVDGTVDKVDAKVDALKRNH